MKIFDYIDNIRIGTFLVDKGVITGKQLDHAISVQNEQGGADRRCS